MSCTANTTQCVVMGVGRVQSYVGGNRRERMFKRVMPQQTQRYLGVTSACASVFDTSIVSSGNWSNTTALEVQKLPEVGVSLCTSFAAKVTQHCKHCVARQ